MSSAEIRAGTDRPAHAAGHPRIVAPVAMSAATPRVFRSSEGLGIAACTAVIGAPAAPLTSVHPAKAAGQPMATPTTPTSESAATAPLHAALPERPIDASLPVAALFGCRTEAAPR